MLLPLLIQESRYLGMHLSDVFSGLHTWNMQNEWHLCFHKYRKVIVNNELSHQQSSYSNTEKLPVALFLVSCGLFFFLL